MTSQTLLNWTPRDHDVMKSKSRRTSTQYFRNKDKPDFNKAKVCFADNLATIHEVPYNYDIYNKANFRFKLPEIDFHKYTPLVCRDPYAKPSKRKQGKFTDMFSVSNTVKLPFIKVKTTDSDARKVASKTKETSESVSELHFPKASTRASEKFHVGNTLHFKYSDFILTKMDGNTSSKDKIFIVK